MPSGHGRVGGENGVFAHAGLGLFKAQAFFGHQLVANFQGGEGAVTFIEVVDTRLDPELVQQAAPDESGCDGRRRRARR